MEKAKTEIPKALACLAAKIKESPIFSDKKSGVFSFCLFHPERR